MRLLSIFTAIICAILSFSVQCRAAASKTEILWDRWGVPHIFANDLESLGRAFGWAQMEAHGELLLRLYGESRGRSAEYGAAQRIARATRI